MSEQNTLEQTAQELFLYGLPLVITELTHRGANDRVWDHYRAFPDAQNKHVVKMNMDTLYSTAWTQLDRTPYLVHIPAITERYYLFSILDAYTNVLESIGTRTPERSTGDYLLLLENAPIPAGYEDYEIIRLKDSLNTLILRIETRGKADYETVHRIQDSITLSPLYPDRVLATEKPGRLSPAEYAVVIPAREFFELFASLTAGNPIREEDYLQKFEEFGYDRHTASLSWSDLDEAHRNALDSARIRGLSVLRNYKRAPKYFTESNGWTVITAGGFYGTDYLHRASIALTGWGANLAKDSVYASAATDSAGEILTNEKDYRLHFAPDGYPHAAVFWSVTLYGEPSMYLAANPINRYAVNSHDLHNGTIRKNEDGSLDIYISPTKPADPDAAFNWLPSPANEEHFTLVIRVYWPDRETLDGKWDAPLIQSI